MGVWEEEERRWERRGADLMEMRTQESKRGRRERE